MILPRVRSNLGVVSLCDSVRIITSSILPSLFMDFSNPPRQPHSQQLDSQRSIPRSGIYTSTTAVHSSNTQSTPTGSVNTAPSTLQKLPIIDKPPGQSLPKRAYVTPKKLKRQIRKDLTSENSGSGSGSKDVKDPIIPPSKASGGRPTPSAAYLAASNAPPQVLQYPQHLLVVIDLNGTLLHRPSRRSPTKFVTRPFAPQFIQYCVDTFTVVIWSSARAENVNNMCNTMLTDGLRKEVVAIWARDKFGLTPEDYDKRVQCYKRLTKIWEDRKIARSHPNYELGMRWDQTNTVLVDDSLEKGSSEPHNLIEIPEFCGDMKESGRILPQVHDFLNLLSMHSNVSACLRARPFKAGLPSAGPS